jgi:hypothetical protein
VKDGLYWYTINSYDDSATLVENPNGEGYSGEVVIPEVMKTSDGVEHKVTGIGQRAFCGTKILSVTMGNNIINIGSHAFSYSTVASAIIGGEYDESAKSANIGNYAFYACDNLTNVVIGDNVRSIYSQVFQNCTSLTSVILGKNLQHISTSTFFGCVKLKDVYSYNESSPYASMIFEDDQFEKMTLHVPEDYYNNYVFNNGEDNYPWQHFGKFEKMNSTTLETCATPKINYANGTVSFTCETEGVEYNSSVEYVENEFNNVSEYPAPSHFRVKVVAVKQGYLPSEVAEQEFTLSGYVDVKTGDYKQGDVNKDGNVNVADHVKLADIIINK